MKKLKFWQRLVPKQSCMYCHFLSKTRKGEVNRAFTKPWSKYDRLNLNPVNNLHLDGQTDYAHCYLNLWVVEDPADQEEKLLRILTKNRSDDGCFLDYEPEIVEYETVVELQRSRSENRKFAINNRNIKIGWMIVIGMGILGIITQFILHFLKQSIIHVP